MNRPLLLAATLLLSSTLVSAGDVAALKGILAKPILEPQQTMIELQKFLEKRLPPMPRVTTKEAWTQEARRMREEVLAKVVYRGEAAAWRDARTKVDWLDTIPGGPGYRLKKVRFEALPGL